MPQSSCWCFVWKVYPLWTVGCYNPLQWLYCCPHLSKVLQDFLYICSCSYIRCIYVYKGYTLLLDHSLRYYEVTLFVSCYGFCFEVYLSDIRIATPAFFHVHLRGKKFFLSLHFHPLRIFCSKIHGNWNWKWPRSGTLFSNFHLSPHHHYIKLTPLINKSSSN